MLRAVIASALCFAPNSWAAHAQTLAIGLDADARLVDGQAVPAAEAKDDKILFLTLEGGRPRVVDSVAAPVSFQGPPRSIAFSLPKRLAFATAFAAPSDAGSFAPLDVISVIDLSGDAPRVSQTFRLGEAPSSVAIDRAGEQLLVTHGDDDSISLLAVEGRALRLKHRTRFAKGSKPLAAAFLPDDRSALVTFAGANKVGLYTVDDKGLSAEPVREMSAGIYPTSIAICGDSGYAVVANYGTVSGDVDTVSLIDLRGQPARVIDTASVGSSPEGLDCSADGRWVIANNQNMTTLRTDDLLYRPRGEAVLLGIEQGRLIFKDRADIGGWGQGAAFVDGGSIAVFETILDRSLHFFRVEGGRFTRMKPMRFEERGPATLGVAR